MRKEIVAMLLAGGQGSRLGVLTKNGAKPAVSFGGKYRIIDFPLSNCINSGIDTVGVLTQYQPLLLNSHIGIGIAWDLDRNYGGVRILPPYEKDAGSEWYTGTANAIYQNISYIDSYDPEYVLILSGDHIYKMDYEHMLDYHKKKEADLTIAAMVVDINEASRFGILVTDSDGRIIEFEEKPENPSSNIASMGIYIFNWKKLKKALCTLSDIHGLDFGKHVIPYLHENYAKIYSYKFRGYWKDVGTLESYWHANMELIDIVPEFNLYQEFWRIYTNSETIKPQYMCENASISKSIISDGCEICGEVHSSVLGNNVIVGHNSAISNSIIMDGVKIGDGCVIEKAIIAENTTIENGVKIGLLDSKPNQEMPHIYNNDIAVIGEKSYIPEGVEIGKNTALMGETTYEDYLDNRLESGQNLIKEAKI